MTDKQIIDGVDVSGCEHYEDLNCYAYRDNCGYPLDCKDNPNCYYKQLKRKEQECEELKSRLNCRCFDPLNNNNRCISYNRIAKDYERDLKQLNKLKAENDTYKKVFEDKDVLLALNEIRTGERHFWFNKTEKLKQTLVEIKDLLLETPTDSQKHCVNAKGVILSRISEVIPNEN